ncbi:S8 family serine peptidase [uncultured Cellulomonas sp.]|uniref:S8 family serine peptidase n=1 Tax=uncultured Cellulomonas sp. TaxID=189682 RepID=UPI00261A5FB8|nr:S8 family serine peptidase [uncultured Cellulomonas sp.]
MRRPLLATLTGLAVAAATALGPAATAAPATEPAPAALPAPATGPAPAALPAPAARPDPSSSGLAVAQLPTGRPDKVAPGLIGAQGVVTAFVQLSAPSALDVARAGAGEAAVGSATEHIEALAEAVVPEDATARLATPAPQRLSVTTNLVAGTVVRGDAAQVRALADRPEVVAVHRVTAKTVDNAATDVLTRARQAWQATGRTGEGMRVGVIDTGIDYTHATLGGPGTPEAYAAAYGADGTGPIPTGSTDPTVFLGGHDFAGPRYDAGGAPGSSPVPTPDDNPIDPPAAAGGGHGTHVAATAVGRGVTPDGATFRGDPTQAPDLTGWPVGPGSAPGAGVYALKVFGDGGGSTHLTIDAMEWAADPNGDHVFDDRLDVLVVSMGTDGAPADDPENLFVDRLADLGVLSVFSAGNGGDVTDAGGVPGSARSGLTVAWSVGDRQTLDGVQVVAAPSPDVVGAHAAQATLSYTGPDVTAPVTYLGDDVTGCAPLPASGAPVAGTIVYLAWDDDAAARPCGTGVRWDNAQAAGAVGVLLGTALPYFPVAIGGNAAIPGAQLTAAATDALLPEVRRGGVVLRMGPSLAGSQTVTNPSVADTLSGGSARGVHGSLGIVKPDVAAPGEQIWSAASGTGTGAAVRSGTSMAAAHVAGIAALVRAAHPDWTPAEVKAAVMNTATHDVHVGVDRTGPVFGPARVGAGRVDALDAVRTGTFAYATDDPALVSVTFGVVPVGARTVVERRTVTVRNTGPDPVRYRTSFDAATTAGGATITTSPATVEVPAGGDALVTLTLTADPATLERDLDPTAARTYDLGAAIPREHVAALSGRLLLRSDDAELRVPVQAAPRLTSALTAEPVTFPHPGSAQAPLTLTGRGVDDGGWRSLVAPLQLVAGSPRLAPPAGPTSASSFAAGDLRQIGFASTAPQVAAVGADPAVDGLVGIGVVTEGEWATLGRSVRIVVDTDVDGDGAVDRQTVVQQTAPDLDVTTAQTWDTRTGALRGEIPVNGTFGDVDTTVFDNNVVVVPIGLAALGVVPGQTPTFTVWTYSPDYAPDPSGTLDRAEPFTVDPYTPEYWFDGGTPGSVLFAAAAGTPVTVHRTAAPGTTAPPLLVLHTHNATPATRAQVVDVVAPLSTPTSTTLQVTGDRVAGADVHLTARIEPAGATGSVTFSAAGQALGTVPVVDGSATLAVPLGAGTRTVSAEFVPASAHWDASSSAGVPVEVTRASSSVALRLTDRAIGFGTPTTALVTVDARTAASGVVEIRAGERVLASGRLGSDGAGAARIALPTDLEVGAHRLTAVYLGSTDVAGSASTPLRLRVTAARPVVTMGTATWTVGRAGRPTVTVTVAGPDGGPTPTGTVTVLVNLRRVGSVDLAEDGTAQFQLPRMSRSALVTAVYGGNAGYRPVVDMRTMRVR